MSTNLRLTCDDRSRREDGESLDGAGPVRLLEHGPASTFPEVERRLPPLNIPSEARSGSHEEQRGADEAEYSTEALLPSLEPHLEEAPQFFQTHSGEEPLQLETRGTTSQNTRPKHKNAHKNEEREFWDKNFALCASVAAKLRKEGLEEEADKLDQCHSRRTHAECQSCGDVAVFLNRCDQLFCPLCQPKLARSRKQSVEWWTREIHQPKHLVLTARNQTTLSPDYVKRMKQALAKLRRRKFARGWQGGFWSLEITNEGRGWHLHFHLLVNARWIDARQLSQEWADLVGQDFAIVKVKDARETDYLRELTKYAVKGTDLAGWQSKDVAAFVTTLKRTRTFGVFGSLYGKRTLFAEWLATIRDHKPACKCGSDHLRFFSEEEWFAQSCEPTPTRAPRPPPSPQTELPLGATQRENNAVLCGH